MHRNRTVHRAKELQKNIWSWDRQACAIADLVYSWKIPKRQCLIWMFLIFLRKMWLVLPEATFCLWKERVSSLWKSPNLCPWKRWVEFSIFLPDFIELFKIQHAFLRDGPWTLTLWEGLLKSLHLLNLCQEKEEISWFWMILSFLSFSSKNVAFCQYFEMTLFRFWSLVNHIWLNLPMLGPFLHLQLLSYSLKMLRFLNFDLRIWSHQYPKNRYLQPARTSCSFCLRHSFDWKYSLQTILISFPFLIRQD